MNGQRTRRAALLGGVFLALAACGAPGRIEGACLASGRPGATPGMCGCVQSVANRMLDRSEQRLAARFFPDPHRAQEIRQSDTAAHDAFWARYRDFGEAVERSCARYR